MRLKPNFIIAILVLLTIAFTTLSIFIAKHPILAFDIKTSLLIQRYQSNWLDKAMLAISFFGELPYSLL